MEGEYESQSWQDRCERYFTSISDTGKDKDQEKHQKNDSENSREKRENGYLDDNDKIWKDLSEVRKRFSEHWLVRRARKSLSVLDIHGAKYASKTKRTAGFIFWIVIVLISVVTFIVLVFFTLREFVEKTTEYRIKIITSPHKVDPGDISLTVCNLNLIKKSKLASSELNDLKTFLDGSNINARTERKTVKEVVNSKSELKAIVLSSASNTLSEFIANIENDVVVQELVTTSDTPLLHRLSNYGKPELLREVTQISMSAVKNVGHIANETLIECWIGNTYCQKKEIQTKIDPVYGNCLVVTSRSNSGTIDLVLNAQSEEYIDQLSPSVGFTVSLSDSLDTVQHPGMIVPPGHHSIISMNKVTTINRLDSSCNPSAVSKKTCENRCLIQHIVKICNCSLYGEEVDLKLCEMVEVSDYICVKSLQHLQMEGTLPCQCQERCSEKKFDLQMTMVEWPSKQYMMQFGNAMLPGLKNITNDYVRNNIAKLTIHLTPETYEEIEEHESNEVIDLLVRIGGLSALVAGVSAVTVLEILFMIVQCIVRLVRYVRKRSDDVASPTRLSDSEITSITWAMYRQRRRFEEVHKMKDKPAHNAGVNALGGNVQARIWKRSSYAFPDYKEANGNLGNNHVTGSNETPTRQNYSRRYDGKNPSHHSRLREGLTKERSHDSDKQNGDKNSKYKNSADNQVNVIRPHRQMDYTHDNRHVPVYTGTVLHPNGYLYTDSNAIERHRQDNVFFYEGGAAYINTPNVSEPVYL